MLRVATVFSGIGAPEQAIKQLGIDYKIVFACDNGERYLKDKNKNILEKQDIDNLFAENNCGFNNETDFVNYLYSKTKKPNNVKKSYLANYNLDEKNWFEDIRFLDGKPFKNKVDLFVGGSPCQSFSHYGHRLGLEDTRGTLFYEFARLVSEIQPKSFIFENVYGLLTHDKGRTWQVIKDVFESLNYVINYEILNAKDFDLPQLRKRLFVVGIRKDLSTDKFIFPKPVPLTHKTTDYLEGNIPNKYYVGEKAFKYIVSQVFGKHKARINQDIIGCQTAFQQYNWVGDFRAEIPQERHLNDSNIYIDDFKGKQVVIRKMIPRELLRLMGFSDDFKIVVDDTVMWRQTGNSIAVPVIKAIIKNIVNILKLNTEDKDKQMTKLRFISLFSGIGTTEMALKRIGIDLEQVGMCEIDKYAEQSYLAIHGNVKNYGDISKVERLDECDFLSYSFCCQDISVSGLQKGFERGSGTRSGLLWEVERLLLKMKEENILPKYLMLENVKNLVGKKFIPEFNKWLEALNKIGYNNYWDILNAKDYGVPQNRERVFCFSIRKDIDILGYTFPEKQVLKLRLKDILEEQVEKKYYLSDKLQAQFTYKPIGKNVIGTTKPDDASRQGQRDLVYSTDTVMGCLNSTDYKQPKQIMDIFSDADTNSNSDIKQKRLFNIYGENTGTGHAGNVYDRDAICPTLTTMAGGNQQPMIFDSELKQIGSVFNGYTKRENSNRGRVYDTTGISPTLNCMEGGNLQPMIFDKTDKVIECNKEVKHQQDLIQHSEGICRCIPAGTHGSTPHLLKTIVSEEPELPFDKTESTDLELVDDFENNKVKNDYKQGYRVYSDNTVSSTITSSHKGLGENSDLYLTNTFKIRKLTPRECWRLMGIDDTDFDKAVKAGLSNCQLYKQAGNAIVVDVQCEMFKNLFPQQYFKQGYSNNKNIKIIKQLSFNF